VPEGPPEAVPFETLVVGEEEDEPVYRAEAGPPIAYGPSGSVIKWLRSRPVGAGTGPDLVAVGDPVFAGAGPEVSWPKEGVLLTEVRADGQARRPGLRAGDVLVSYDGAPVADAAALRAAVQAVGSDRSDIAVGVWREGEVLEVRAASGLLGVGVALEAPEVAGPKFLAGGQIAIARRSATDRGSRLVPLPGTRTEVDAIAAAFRGSRREGARVTTLLVREARESALFDAAGGAPHLHLATHGIVDATETASFSALALTMPAVPVVGDDGFLTLMDPFRRW
jgi:membrane-associated protease RseP (regulator of RpoE activity)